MEDMPIAKPKEKIPWWKKVLAILPIIFLATWALAEWNPRDNPREDKNLIRVSGYDFYALEDETFGTYLELSAGSKIPIAFRLDPRNAVNIPMDNGIVSKILNADKVYIAVNPNQKDFSYIAVASAEISRIMGLYSKQIIAAYTEDSNPINPNVPLKTCKDASDTTAVITLEIADRTGVFLEGNCTAVKGDNALSLIDAADKLGMNLVGIRL